MRTVVVRLFRRGSRPLRRGAFVVAALAFAIALGAPGGARSENRFSVKGNYFREASTRVIQPMMEVTADLPKGYDIGAYTLIDAISSASIAAGAVADSVFHENRYEGGLRVGRTLGLNHVGLFARYSHEPDYLSYAGGLSFTRDVWGRTGTLAVNLAYGYDDIVPFKPLDPRSLKTYYLGLSYSQILSPTSIAQLDYELTYLTGPHSAICNPYIAHPNLGREQCPDTRIRHAIAPKLAYYFPSVGLGLQLRYRFYFDTGSLGSIGPWGITSHTIEPRIYKSIGSDVEIRLAYRYFHQSKARFWCNSRPDWGGDLGCYPMDAQYHSWDPKFGDFSTQYPELKVAWDLHTFANIRSLAWLAFGTLDLSYAYYFEGTPYGGLFTDVNAPPIIDWGFTRSHGGAHVIQTGYTMPF